MLKELIAIFKKDTLMDQAFTQSYQMLDITKEMYLAAKTSLREDETNKLPADVYEMDISVNKFERKVRRKVLNHLSVSDCPDINSALVLVSIIIDIERIGDYTKNILEIAQNHPLKLNCGLYEEDLIKIEEAVLDTFTRVRNIVEEADDQAAAQLLEDYQWINGLCDQHATDYLNERDKTISSGDAVALSLYFRYLKRINSHMRNVISSVVNPFDKIGFFKRKTDKRK